MVTLIAAISWAQLQRSATSFDVYSVSAEHTPKLIGEGEFASTMSLRRGRNIVWSHRALDSKSGWRKEWTFDEKGELTFQSYEVSFGDLKSRWNLSRSEGRWNLYGSKSMEMPKNTPSVHDVAALWFVEKKASLGSHERISAFDTGTFAVRRGVAKYLRDERMVVEGASTPARVVERRFEDEIQIWYVGDKGEVWRIDLVYPNASANLVFKDRRIQG